MTAAELIEKLREVPQDMNVVFSHADRGDYDIDHVKVYEDLSGWKQVELS